MQLQRSEVISWANGRNSAAVETALLAVAEARVSEISLVDCGRVVSTLRYDPTSCALVEEAIVSR